MKKEAQDDLIWKALADPTRRTLLDLVAANPRTTGALCAEFPHLGRTTVMKHLDVLERAKLVLVRREGRERFNFANPIPLQQIYERWLSRHVAQRAQTLTSLRKAAEERGREVSQPIQKPHPSNRKREDS